MPANCASASTCSTPGIIGRDGKCPVKCGSLRVTHLIPTADLPISYSTTLSTSRKGYLCGSMPLMSSRLNIVLTVDVNEEISAADRGFVGVSRTASLSFFPSILVVLLDVDDGARKAVEVDARAAASS